MNARRKWVPGPNATSLCRLVYFPTSTQYTSWALSLTSTRVQFEVIYGMDAFVYSPLSNNDIRLVTLHSESYNDQIKCSLSHRTLPSTVTNLSTRPESVWSWDKFDIQRQPYYTDQYDALSYAWGDPTTVHSISLNRRRFLIAKNLYYALQGLRLLNRARILWIDAICIDQGNIPERSRQVQKMKDIYSSASSVIVWLGNPSKNAQMAFSQIIRMNRERLAPRPGLGYDTALLSQPEDCLKGLAELWQRPWWERIWVVQEVVVAVDVVVACGQNIIPWNFLSCVSQEIREKEFTSHEKAQLLRMCDYQKFSAIDHFRRQSMTLLQLLKSTRDYKATDPRDKIYALLGMASDIETTHLSVDYNRSVAEVYQSVVHHMITVQRSLDIISSSTLPTIKPGTPTWVPNWEASDGLLPLIGPEMVRNQFQSAGESQAVINMSRLPKILEAKGICVDKIDFMGGAVKLAHDELCTIRRWEYIATEYLGLRKDHENFWRTIIADKTNTGCRATSQFGKAFRSFMDNTGPSLLETQSFSGAVTRAIMGRRFFLTRKGYLGLGPSNILLNDMVCVLGGCQVPLILRQVEKSQQLVGEAYVHGIMDGEVIEGLREKCFELKTFSIE